MLLKFAQPGSGWPGWFGVTFWGRIWLVLGGLDPCRDGLGHFFGDEVPQSACLRFPEVHVVIQTSLGHAKDVIEKSLIIWRWTWLDLSENVENVHS